MGATLIRNGHRDVLQYRMNFVEICLEEMGDAISDAIRYNALAHRLSKLDDNAFQKVTQPVTSGGKKAPIVVDHEAQMRELNSQR